MATVQQAKVEVIHDKAFNPLSMIGAARLHFVFSSLTLLMLTFFNLRTFEHGLDFCFDGSKQGIRLETCLHPQLT